MGIRYGWSSWKSKISVIPLKSVISRCSSMEMLVPQIHPKRVVETRFRLKGRHIRTLDGPGRARWTGRRTSLLYYDSAENARTVVIVLWRRPRGPLVRYTCVLRWE